jgi:hypothetical protein
MTALSTTATLTFGLVLLAPAWSSAQVPQPAGPLTSAVYDGAWSRGTGDAPASTQLSQAPAGSDANDLRVSIYPVLLWVPLFGADVNVPAFPDIPGGPDKPGESGSTSASFSGAALFGLSLAKARWRIEADGIWASMSTTRDRPLINVDLDIIYGHASGGVKVYKDLYVTAGVRRLALKYDIELGERPHFIRKPGVWDPLVGLGWHGTLGPKWELHVAGEGGGFDVGADVDVSATVRADWKIVRHVGMTFGYSALHLKISDTVGQRTLTVKQTLHGPVLGLGVYF